MIRPLKRKQSITHENICLKTGQSDVLYGNSFSAQAPIRAISKSVD